MSALFTSALAASNEAASGQHYPHGALYVVATPIGNLADITLRALHVLSMVDHIACEDTRHTQSMLRAYGIDRHGNQLLALHQHNEAQAAALVIEMLRQGKRVAYVSDAGTPGISDPGARLVAALQAQGLQAIPLPGASSVTALLCVAGVSSDSGQAGGFVFAGFLSSKTSERDSSIQALTNQDRAVVLLEAPHRIEALAIALSNLRARKLTVGRELSKQFEEIATLSACEFPAWLAANPNRLRGEFTLVVHPPEAAASSGPDLQILTKLLEHLPLKTAVQLAADLSGQPRNALYQAALSLKQAPTDNAQTD